MIFKRKRANARTTRVVDRVDQGRHDCGDDGLSKSTPGPLPAEHPVRFNLGHFVDAQNSIVVEVGLHHAAFVDRDFTVQSGGEAECDGAFDLGVSNVRVDQKAGIGSHNHAIGAEPALSIEGHFHDDGKESIGVLKGSYAASPISAKWVIPIRFSRSLIEHGAQPRNARFR